MILYLSMDVVDASFGQLRSAIAAARDFSAADAAHRQYVDSLVSQVGCWSAWHEHAHGMNMHVVYPCCCACSKPATALALPTQRVCALLACRPSWT